MKSPVEAVPAGAQRVLIASTAMLAFISFWRAAAIVLNDMGSSAFYAGAIAEHFVGKTAPWFILILVTIYFWWENIKGIPESSEKALRIMYVTTVMVVLMIVWSGYTLWVRGAHLPPLPRLANIHYADDALGWLKMTTLPYTFGL